MTKEKDEIVETKVDKDILDFLKAIYFGDFTNPLQARLNLMLGIVE